MSHPQWPGAAGPGQHPPPAPPPGAPPGAPVGQPYGPAGGYPYGPPPGQPYGPPPGYPYGPPPGQFGPWGYPPPGGPPPRRRRGLWIIGALVLVAAVVAAAVLVRQLGGPAAAKPPTASAVELLVAQGDFPKLAPPARFSVTLGNGDDDAVNVSPPECKDVLGDAEATTDTARADLSNAAVRGGDGPRSYTVRVIKSADPHYLDQLQADIDGCESVSIDRAGARIDGTVEPLPVSDAPMPVTGAAAKFVSEAYGVKVAMTMQLFAAVVRGTAVQVSLKRMSINAAKDFDKPDNGAVDLLTKQVDKIEAAE